LWLGHKRSEWIKLVELIIFVGALCIVGVPALRFGYDSRIPAQSKEQDHANRGLSWEHQIRSAGTLPESTMPQLHGAVWIVLMPQSMVLGGVRERGVAGRGLVH
jgi:hypothetical protein